MPPSMAQWARKRGHGMTMMVIVIISDTKINRTHTKYPALRVSYKLTAETQFGLMLTTVERNPRVSACQTGSLPLSYIPTLSTLF